MATEFYPGYNSHRWNDARGMSATCKACGLDSYEAENTGPCRGHQVHVCPTEQNANTHGNCGQVFDSAALARYHFFNECGHSRSWDCPADLWARWQRESREALSR